MTATPSLSASLQHMGQVLLAGDVAALTDAELVGRFVERRDEVAFTALVRRYCTVVFGVCRRVLRHEQDAEDAFQATFLVFARNAARVRHTGAVGNWLYGVAVNVARKAKATRHRRLLKEQEAATQPRPDTEPVVPDDLREILDGELKALPDKYRAPIVMCDMLGLTTNQAAAEVGCPPKTLGTRLLRGRSLLAQRLTRRGVAVSAAVLAVALGQYATAAIPPVLLTTTSRIATVFASGSTAGVTPTVAALTIGVTNVMLSLPLKVAMILGGGFLALVVMHSGSLANRARALHSPNATIADANAPAGTAPRPVREVDWLDRLHMHMLDFIGINPHRHHAEPVAAVPDDKKDEKPVLSGKWSKKDAEPIIAFEKDSFRFAPHGSNEVIVLLCEYTLEKGTVKAKVSGYEGKEDAKTKFMTLLPIGSEFSFKWTVKKDTAVLDELKGEKAEKFKSHLEGDYEVKN